MGSEGHYWQQQQFYCSHWTPDIEDTFVKALLEHHRNGAFHHDLTNCHAVMCALFDINAKYGSTFSYSYCQRRLAKLKIRHCIFQWITRKFGVGWDPKFNTLCTEEYVWEQISQAKVIGKAYVRAPEPHWDSLTILFGECGLDANVEDEQEFFDRSGTCDHDGWVNKITPHVEEVFDYGSDSYKGPSSPTDPSWWAFMQEHYAFDTDPDSVNMNVTKIRRPTTSEPRSPMQQSPVRLESQKPFGTPSSCASNDPEFNAKSPSPMLDRYLNRRPPKKPKF